MKKFLSIVVLVFLCVSLVACGQKQDNKQDTGVSSDTTQQSSTNEPTNEPDTNEEDEYTNVATVPLKGIFVNGYKGMRLKKVTYANMFYVDNESMTALAYDRTNPFNGTIEDVVGFLNDAFLKDINNNCEVTVEGCKIAIENSENVTINGFESIKFTGNIPSDGVELHVYGYSFVINDIPCMVVGLVSDRDQNPELISSVNNHVDNMVKTIRTES